MIDLDPGEYDSRDDERHSHTPSRGGRVIRFKLSPALARAHRQNRGKAMTETEAVAFVEAKRTGAATR